MLYVLRHFTPDIQPNTCYGQLDVPLAKHEHSVSHLKATIALIPDLKILCSPLIRCTHTAKQLGLTYTLDKRLTEIHFGSWEGVAWSDIPHTEIDHWAADIINYAPGNGESYIQLAKRVNSLLFEYSAEIKERNLLFITHSGVIKHLCHATQHHPHCKTTLEQALTLDITIGGLMCMRWL